MKQLVIGIIIGIVLGCSIIGYILLNNRVRVLENWVNSVIVNAQRQQTQQSLATKEK